MRWAMPHPCIGSSASVRKIKKSSVPCKRSVDGAIDTPRHSTKKYAFSLSNVKGTTGEMSGLSSPAHPQNCCNSLSSDNIDRTLEWQGIMAKIAILKREQFS